MSTKTVNRKTRRQKRHRRVRRKVSGTAERPRMAISISNRAMNVQLIDDVTAITLAAASTARDERVTVETAKALGVRAAEVAQAKGITRIVVDRGGFKYHGRVQAFVEAAIEAGLVNRADAAPTAEPKEE